MFDKLALEMEVQHSNIQDQISNDHIVSHKELAWFIVYNRQTGAANSSETKPQPGSPDTSSSWVEFSKCTLLLFPTQGCGTKCMIWFTSSMMQTKRSYCIW